MKANGNGRMIGNFEELVLLAVNNFIGEEENYSAKIREKLEYALEKSVSPYAVHRTLKRLEARGLIASVTLPRDTVRKGPRPLFYLLTPQGVADLSVLRRWRRRICNLKKTA